MATNSLWGDIPETPLVRPPVVVLREQADLLEQLTKGLLVCRIDRDQQGTDTVLTFSIVAPALNNYAFVLLKAVHEIDLYPVRLLDVSAQRWLPRCPDEGLFLSGLSEVFQSEKTRRVISGLLAQIQLDL